MTITAPVPVPTTKPFEVPLMSKDQGKRHARTAKAARYVTLWKDPDATKGGLQTFADGKRTASRTFDEVSRATDPTPHVLQDTAADRAFLDDWLAAFPTGPEPTAHPVLAVPMPLVRDILGWRPQDLAT